VLGRLCRDGTLQLGLRAVGH